MGDFLKILLVEDDISLCENISRILQLEGYDTTCCYNGDDGLYFIENNSCDLVILDRMLPEMSGIEILKVIRQKTISVPVLMLSARATVDDRIVGLDAGADDYLVKPFEYGELLARVRALVRRPSEIENDAVLQYKDILYMPIAHELKGPNGKTFLTKREGAILELFLRNNGGIVTKETLFSRVWGLDSDSNESNISTYIHFLRRRFASVGSKVNIINHRGVGFSLSE